MGDMELCAAYDEQPEVVHEIHDTLSDTTFRVLEEVTWERLD